MEAVYPFETLVLADKSTRLYIPGDEHEHLHRRDNVISLRTDRS